MRSTVSSALNRLVKGSRTAPAKVQVVDYNPNTPDNSIRAGDGPAANDPAHVHTVWVFPGRMRRSSAHASSTSAMPWIPCASRCVGSVAGLYPGAVFSFEHPAQSQYSGDYLVGSINYDNY